MTDYSKIMISSDLDAFKNSGAIQAPSIVMSGSIGAGGELVQETSFTLPETPDFYEILFSSSSKHPGVFKPMRTSPYTLITEVTFASELGVDLTVRISGNTIYIRGAMFNPYSSAVTITTTTINFRYIPYESTI